MISHRRDPYLWIHLAGLATVPLWLDGCLAGLAVGDPGVPPWVEISTLVLVGCLPVLWMQWQRPFYIFSLLAIAQRPDRLSDDRRRLLSLQTTWLHKGFVLIGAIALVAALVWLYQLAPIAAVSTPFGGQSRPVGWLICALSFGFANLFVQVPASVLRLLVTPAIAVAKTPPYEPSAILQNFTVIGLRIAQILPEDLEPSISPVAQPTEAEEPTVGAGQALAGAEPLSEVPETAETGAEPLGSVTVETFATGTDIPTEAALESLDGAADRPEDAVLMVESAEADNVPSVSEALSEPAAAILVAEPADLARSDAHDQADRVAQPLDLAATESEDAAIMEPETVVDSPTVESLDDVLRETEQLSQPSSLAADSMAAPDEEA